MLWSNILPPVHAGGFAGADISHLTTYTVMDYAEEVEELILLSMLVDWFLFVPTHPCERLLGIFFSSC